MVSPDALSIVLHQDTMRPAATGLGPAISFERGEDAGSFRHVEERILDVIIPTGSDRQRGGLAPVSQRGCCMTIRRWRRVSLIARHHTCAAQGPHTGVLGQ